MAVRQLVRWLGAVTVVTALAAVGLAGTATAAPEGPIRSAGGTPIDNSFLVLTRPGTSAAEQLAEQLGGRIGHRFTAAAHGFEVAIGERQARRLAAHPDVSYVERNATHQVLPTAGVAGVQPNPPSWGLDRIDQRLLPLDLVYNYPTTGAGVRVYVYGTGIRFTHNDFGGRAVSGFDAIDGGSADDCNGNGTHLAGTVGGTAHGVAKAATLVAIRNLTCAGSGSTAQVVAGIDWVTANAVKPAVALMTLGGPGNPTMDAAVRAAIASGVQHVVAAGASNADACNFSPGRITEAITVGSVDSTDTRSSFSNYGPCLDVFSPGNTITSTWYTSDTATAVLSGTSMATAHVAGAAAMLLETNPSWTPAQLETGIETNATPDVVINPGAGSPNRLVYVGATIPPPLCTASFGTNVNIPDSPAAAVTSAVTITGCPGNASASTAIEVHIIHPYRGDLRILIRAPDGTEYLLKEKDSDSGDDIHTTYVANLSTESANGTWRLKVRDRRAGNVGFIDSWRITV